MSNDERQAEYLADGLGDRPDNAAKLDSVRLVLATSDTWEVPPEGSADQLLQAIRADSGETDSGNRRVWWPWVASAAAAVLLIVFLFATSPSGTDVVLAGTEFQPDATGVARLDPTGDGWEIMLELADLPPAEPGFYYEGWVWNDDGEGVSIGTFHLRGQNNPITLWAGVDVNRYPSIWISLQEEGGGAELSDEVVMRGRFEPTNSS